MKAKQTFSKKNRLLKPDDFQRVYKQGCWVSNHEIAANFIKTDNPFVCLGITVSKKVSKRAVDRNRIKRLFREWFRKNQQQVNSLDLVLTAKPAINQKSNLEVESALNEIWKKILKNL